MGVGMRWYHATRGGRPGGHHTQRHPEGTRQAFGGVTQAFGGVPGAAPTEAQQAEDLPLSGLTGVGVVGSSEFMHEQNVALAYDTIAAEYDRQREDDEWMRQKLWHHYGRAFQAGQHVLDVGCGTGTDAIFLARRGIRVTAIDISPQMIAQVQVKMERCHLTSQIEAMVLDFGRLSSLPPGTFDGVISSSAALNTLPTLTGFAQDAARLVRPGGRVILHLLNRVSLWEWLGLISQREWSAARRLSKQRERTFDIGGRSVRHYLPRLDEAYALFEPHFRLCDAYGLGILRPPSTVRRIPFPVVAGLGQLDDLVCSKRPFINLGRFIVLDLVKNSGSFQVGRSSAGAGMIQAQHGSHSQLPPRLVHRDPLGPGWTRSGLAPGSVTRHTASAVSILASTPLGHPRGGRYPRRHWPRADHLLRHPTHLAGSGAGQAGLRLSEALRLRLVEFDWSCQQALTWCSTALRSGACCSEPAGRAGRSPRRTGPN
jgi:ubiquinone/menaquinone biosynthesis C-methylase UbiE